MIYKLLLKETIIMTPENKQVISSLSAIALEYYSDTDTEDDICQNTNKNSDINKSTSELGYANTSVYRATDKDVSSSEDSSSDSESISDKSSESDSTEDSDNDSSSNDSKKNDNLRKKNTTKNQKKCNERKIKSELDDLPPIEDLQISVSENSCVLIGDVSWMMIGEPLIIVHPMPNIPTLNYETVLFVENGKKALGKIHDIFGHVTDPHYSIRFNSLEHIKENGIVVGMPVYYCPESPYTLLVFLPDLTKMKGTDAVEDSEAPDFSDDEEERKYYETIKKKKTKETILSKDENSCVKRRFNKSTSNWKQNNPWNSNRKNNFQGRNSQIGDNRSFATSNTYSQSEFPYLNSYNQSYNRFYPYTQCSNNFQSHNVGNNEASIPNPPFRMVQGFQSTPSTRFNEHNTYSVPNITFPHTNLQLQPTSYRPLPLSLVPPYLPSDSYLIPPPPPPPLPSSSMKQNYDTSR